ncbi:hypothetical protein [Sinomicrobium soli]|uniref:hypothetical protein n=1 Tax=Sinomicrobium sp. N-1-3-6 TaxID=2219864 RepID=UPI000DCAFF59|nr:hypothetical protein [Sinomicrobium sp. N-1-3-6]RAV30226.1 hypothetical protein DN748_05390 [Sinomicrobium sp. N-1-3-6]
MRNFRIPAILSTADQIQNKNHQINEKSLPVATGRDQDYKLNRQHITGLENHIQPPVFNTIKI